MLTFKQYSKQYLEEGLPPFTIKGEATYVEDVIVHCINTYNTTKKENKFIELSKQDKELVKFVTDHKKVKISNDIDKGIKKVNIIIINSFFHLFVLLLKFQNLRCIFQTLILYFVIFLFHSFQ